MATLSTGLTTNSAVLYSCTNYTSIIPLEFSVYNSTNSAANALVNVPEMHASDYLPIEPGKQVLFRNEVSGIRTVNAKSSTGTNVTVLAGPTAIGRVV